MKNLLLLALILGSCPEWVSAGDDSKPSSEPRPGTYTLDGYVPVEFAGRKVKAKLVGEVVVKAGKLDNTFAGTYAGRWGKDAGMSDTGNVEGVFEDEVFSLKVTTPGVGSFTAELTWNAAVGKWVGTWKNGADVTGDFNMTPAKAKALAPKK